MKIYISVDMEGISAISNPAYVMLDGRLYQEGRRLMTEDVNAAVRGAFDGGADTVVVADMHGGSNHIVAEALDPRALLLAGAPHAPRFPYLDKAFDGLFLVGYHAMAGTAMATLEHTMTSMEYHKFCVNDIAYGEVGIDAEIAAACGVPVVMVSGDDKLCDEAKGWLGEQIEAACVKLGTGRASALGLSPERGRRRVYDSARMAVERLGKGESFPLAKVYEPATVTITYKHMATADSACASSWQRVDGYTVRRAFPRLCDMYGGIWMEDSQQGLARLTD